MKRRCGDCQAEWDDDGDTECYSCNGDNTFLLPDDIDLQPNISLEQQDSRFLKGNELKLKLRVFKNRHG